MTKASDIRDESERFQADVERAKDAIDSVLQWREAVRHTDDADVLRDRWPELEYDEIAKAVLNAIQRAESLLLVEAAKALQAEVDRQGFYIHGMAAGALRRLTSALAVYDAAQPKEGH